MGEPTHPEIRERIVLNVRHLADREYQRRVWVDHRYPHAAYYDDLTTTFEALDDTNVLHGALDCVGSSLKSSAEAEALLGLGAALDRVFAAHGTTLSDAEYLGLPEWSPVVEAAAKALELVEDDGD